MAIDCVMAMTADDNSREVNVFREGGLIHPLTSELVLDLTAIREVSLLPQVCQLAHLAPIQAFG